MRQFDEALADAVQVVQRSIVNAGPVASASSCRIPVSAFAAESDGVVSRASAQVFAGSAVLPGTHSSVARPDSPRHRTYTTVRRLLVEAAAVSAVDTVLSLGPARLEVHNAADAGAAVGESDRVPELTRYLLRAHDRRIRAVLGEVLAGGPSRLIVLTGESSTGKTRALYEALVDLAPSAPLLHPVGDLDLLELLDEGRVRSGCVVWLNEAQRFLYNRDAAARLRAVMTATPGIAVVGTLWNNPYWNELTEVSGGNSGHDQARALLTHPATTVRIDVPVYLNSNDLDAWRSLAGSSGDRRLQQALAAGVGDGKVVQHLSGGPELLAEYLAAGEGGSLFTAAEHALITAALDARRLGHHGPFPAALLATAADGDLAPRHRSPDPQWAEPALHALTTGVRADGSRTDIRNTLTALTAVYARSGAPAAYEPADYLDQHARRLRAERYGTPALWDALIEHTVSPDDQDRLAEAAWERGLRTTAVRLWSKATMVGHLTGGLLKLGEALDPDEFAATFTAARVDLRNPYVLRGLFQKRATRSQALATLMDRDPAAHADLTKPSAVAWLLRVLHAMNAEQAVATLVARDPATNAGLTDLSRVWELCEALEAVGAEQQALVLIERAVAHADLTGPDAVAWFLWHLREAGAERAIATLVDREPAVRCDVTDAYGAANLISRLHQTGALRQVAILAERAARHAELASWFRTMSLYSALCRVGAERDVEVLLERLGVHGGTDTAQIVTELWKTGAKEQAKVLAARAAANAELTDPRAVARALMALHVVGAAETLLDRDPAAHADLTDPEAVAALIWALRDTGDEQAFRALLGRDLAAHADLSRPDAVAWLLSALLKLNADETVTALLDRDPAAQVDLANPLAVTLLRVVLDKAGAEQAVSILERRAKDAGHLPESFAPYGREPDGSPSPPWTARTIMDPLG
ncbi:hypothetical protein [Catenulispora yoronensis]|uniref:hypothetical protein n=1 Tax=Catenulispora yoronensis TaxID=450799 RepID=UPI0031CFE52C